MSQSMVHVLLVYSHAQSRLIRQEEFSESAKAIAAYQDAERAQLGKDGLEVVLIGADSIATIMKTHRHYFEAEMGFLPTLVGFEEIFELAATQS